MPTVSSSGAQIFYSTRGQGPTCLVLSVIGAAPYEHQTPPPLPDKLRLAYVELRGTGRSTGQPSGLTMDALVEDLEAVRKDLGEERVAVLGHSVLGVLAVEYGRRCPDRVSHVILAGTPPRTDMNQLGEQAKAFFEKDASEERKRLLRERLSKLPRPNPPLEKVFLAQTPTRFFDPTFDPSPILALADNRPGMIKHVMGALTSGWDITQGADSLRVPTLIAHGRYDYTVPHVMWQGVAEKLPNTTLHLFERSGHQPFFEEPERFTQVVMEWMSGGALSR